MRKRSGLDVEHLFRSSTPRAVLFSALTIVVSFGSLAFSEHRGMSGMGLLLTIALSFALLCALVVLPAVMSAIEDK
jgi:predicted RND superfamily exporter protein